MRGTHRRRRLGNGQCALCREEFSTMRRLYLYDENANVGNAGNGADNVHEQVNNPPHAARPQHQQIYTKTAATSGSVALYQHAPQISLV